MVKQEVVCVGGDSCDGRYHDTHDTMYNIVRDDGAAVCAITIESMVRAAQSVDSPL